MKKNKIKNILFLMVFALAIVIPLTLPKSLAKIIKTTSTPITNFNQLELGKIYTDGTAIQLENSYIEIFYYDMTGKEIGYYEYDSDNQTPPVPYVGLSEDGEMDYIYWEVTEAEIYSSNSGFISFKAIENKINDCNLETFEIGDICMHNAKASSNYGANVIYVDKNDNDLGSMSIPPQNDGDQKRIGYASVNNNDVSLEDTTKIWEVKDIFNDSSTYYWSNVVFKPYENNQELTFELVCDSHKIKYNEKTTCHLLVKNYLMTTDPITVELDNKEDLIINSISPQRYFNAENNNGKITVTTDYFSTTPESLELFSFEVQAKKETNKTNNIEIKNITYYNGNEYPEQLRDTIEISNSSILPNNPVTSNPLVKILIIALLVLGSTKLLLRKKNV